MLTFLVTTLYCATAIFPSIQHEAKTIFSMRLLSNVAAVAI